MIDYHISLTIIGALIAISGTIPYIYNLFKKNTKPHIFSWLLWAIIGWTVFFAQLVSGGGVGVWVTATMASASTIITVGALYKGKIDYLTKTDISCLIISILGIILWIITKNPLNAVVLVTITDAIAYIPTFRKGFYKPNEETSTVYIAGIVQNFIGIFALESFNLTNVLYPSSLVITNSAFIILIITRRIFYKKIQE